jgi:Fe2+ or Zn2+ uptake regulation protein
MDKTVSVNTAFIKALMIVGVWENGHGMCPKFPLLDVELNHCNSIKKERKTKRRRFNGVKALYILLCCYSDSETRETFVSRRTLMRELRITSKSTFYNWLNVLEEQGYIEITPPSKFTKGDTIYKIVDKPAKFSQPPKNPNLEDEYKNIAEHGLFADKTKIKKCGECDKCREKSGCVLHDGLGYGKIPKKFVKDERINFISTAIYGYFAVFAYTKKGFFKGMGAVARPRHEHILYHLGICVDTYYKNLRILKTCNYVTVYNPRNSRTENYAWYVLNKCPDMSKGQKKGEKRYVAPVHPNVTAREKLKQKQQQRSAKKQRLSERTAEKEVKQAENQASKPILFSEVLNDIRCNGLPNHSITAEKVNELYNSFISGGGSEEILKNMSVITFEKQLLLAFEGKRDPIYNRFAYLKMCVWKILHDGIPKKTQTKKQLYDLKELFGEVVEEESIIRKPLYDMEEFNRIIMGDY